MNGAAAYDRLRAIRPEVKAVFISDSTVAIVRNDGCGGNDVPVLPKPIIADRLLRSVREAPGA
jgi:hypothetical protein